MVVEYLLLEQFLRARDSTDHGVVCFGADTLISNRAAMRLLAGLNLVPLWDRVTTAGPLPATLQLAGTDGGVVVAECRDLDLPADEAGGLLLLRASAVAGPPKPPSLPDWGPSGLVGSSAGWRHVEHQVAALGLSDGHGLITGERGAGKLHVALAVVAVRGLVPAILDTVESGALGVTGWLEHVAATLGQLSDDSMVVVVRLERLEPEAFEPLVDLLGRCPVPSLATAVGSDRSGRPGDGLDADGFFTDRIHVPALRHRGPDVSLLAGHFDARHGTGGLVWTPEALEIMGQYLWPGNVKELEQVVEDLIRRLGPQAEVHPDALPEELLRSVRRRPLTRLEEAEVDVILGALAEASGNKDGAAHLIGIHRATLYRKLQNYGLDVTLDT
ncbi:MAG: sigma-54 dependent transcriptional regulator, acetoin dehydrogenase operon transcriptional [Actinomycetota bacterium]|nr:sigma-54 dependent transcriptional regulator, acetoin dehydrogenase operon transcriptional [Actinomycetota bacterium]